MKELYYLILRFTPKLQQSRQCGTALKTEIQINGTEDSRNKPTNTYLLDF